MSEKHKSTKNEMPHFSHFSQQRKWNYLFFLVFAWEDQIRDEAKTNLYLVLMEGFPYTIINAKHIARVKNEFQNPL